MKQQLNVLWIMTDQHRADCLGYMGHPVVQTPHLDQLAAEGVVFENAFCQSPVCMASRASLMTGRYPGSVRVRGMGVLPPSEITFPEMLVRELYLTAAFGKTHFTPELYTRRQLESDVPILDWHAFAGDACLAPVPDDVFKMNYGYDVHVGCDDANQGLYREWLLEHRPDLAALVPHPAAAGEPEDLYVSPYPSEYHRTTFVAESCADYLRNSAGHQPWFTYCSFTAPHHPFEAPADQIARYNPDSIPLPDIKGGVDLSLLPPHIAEAAGEMLRYMEPVQRRIILHYLAAISLVDDQIGKLIAILRETGQLERTIIVFNADHGEFLGHHGLLRKPSIHFDETLRVPLLMRLPDGIAAGRRVADLVELIDVCPTLLGLLDMPLHPGIQGIDWSNALRQGDAIGREDIYADMFDLKPQKFGNDIGPFGAVRTLRTKEWKLNIYPTAGRQYGQLFNLLNDPDESQNLYADPTYRDIREEMLWRLLSRIHHNTDPLPLLLTQW